MTRSAGPRFLGQDTPCYGERDLNGTYFTTSMFLSQGFAGFT
jgi:hypothetical protein